jgi:hypothetical protein
MNAYELADWLDRRRDAYEPNGWSADMLRQQADRIAELEKDLAVKTRDRDVFRDFTLAYEKRIAELEKDLAKYDELAIDDLEGRRIIWCDCGDAITQDSGAVCGVCASFRSTKEQSAEPVAWIKKDTLIFLGNYEFGSITIQVQKQKDDEFDIPLYTTPQIKELSDEEITEVLNDENIAEYHQGNWLVLPYAFARAILKKASEK